MLPPTPNGVCPRHLLGFNGRGALDHLPDGEVAKLLYRDAIPVKHSSKKRLANEMDSIALEGESLALYQKTSILPKDKLSMQGGPLSKALCAYLLEVSRRDPSLVFSVERKLLGNRIRMVELSYPSLVDRGSFQAYETIKYFFISFYNFVTCHRVIIRLNRIVSVTPVLIPGARSILPRFDSTLAAGG